LTVVLFINVVFGLFFPSPKLCRIWTPFLLSNCAVLPLDLLPCQLSAAGVHHLSHPRKCFLSNLDHTLAHFISLLQVSLLPYASFISSPGLNLILLL